MSSCDHYHRDNRLLDDAHTVPQVWISFQDISTESPQDMAESDSQAFVGNQLHETHIVSVNRLQDDNHGEEHKLGRRKKHPDKEIYRPGARKACLQHGDAIVTSLQNSGSDHNQGNLLLAAEHCESDSLLPSACKHTDGKGMEENTATTCTEQPSALSVEMKEQSASPANKAPTKQKSKAEKGVYVPKGRQSSNMAVGMKGNVVVHSQTASGGALSVVQPTMQLEATSRDDGGPNAECSISKKPSNASSNNNFRTEKNATVVKKTSDIFRKKSTEPHNITGDIQKEPSYVFENSPDKTIEADPKMHDVEIHNGNEQLEFSESEFCKRNSATQQRWTSAMKTSDKRVSFSERSSSNGPFEDDDNGLKVECNINFSQELIKSQALEISARRKDSAPGKRNNSTCDAAASEGGRRKQSSSRRSSKAQVLTSADNKSISKSHNADEDVSLSTNRGGLIRLPPQQDGRSLGDNSALVRGQMRAQPAGAFLFNPEDPDTPIQVNAATNDFRQLSSETSYMIPVPIVFPPPPPQMLSAVHYGNHGCSAFRDDYSPSLEVKSNDSKVAALLRDVIPLERQLCTLASHRLESVALEHFHRLRGTVRSKLEMVLLSDIEYSANHSIDQMLWKSIYHQVIENMRNELQQEDDSSSAAEIKLQLDDLLDEATDYYESLLKKLERQHKFKLSEFTQLGSVASASRSLKFVLLLCQRILISLGDVARYRIQNNKEFDYGRARSYYLKASLVSPKNGKPYNQLAIIAVHTKRKFDATYYFIRSLAASNAFLSAKESLKAIFNELLHSYEEARKQRERAKIQKQNIKLRKEGSGRTSNYSRIEIWISPVDGSSIMDKVDDDDDEFENPKKMPYNELNRQAIKLFLCCQGMLFTKIGMERFPEASSKFLHQLTALLQHSPLVNLTAQRLIQMFAICMFSVHHTGLQGTQTYGGETCRSYVQEQAVLLSLDTFAVIVQRCTVILTSHVKEHKDPAQLAVGDLPILLPTIKLFSDWMTCHSGLWNPPPCPRDPVLGPVLDIWDVVANFVNMLAHLDISAVWLFNEDDDGARERLVPVEDHELTGFLPLMSLNIDVRFVDSDSIKDVACQCYRISKLITFADYLCGIEPPVLGYDVQKTKYYSLLQAPTLLGRCEVKEHPKTESFDDDESIESEGLQDALADDQEQSHLHELQRHKKELSQQLAAQLKLQQAHQAVFEKENYLIKLEVHPIFLVADTNCFIEYNAAVRRLIECKRFTIVVPLLVINELDGLAKHAHSDKYLDTDHASEVRTEARAAIDYLEAQFEVRNQRLRALTAAGTELDTISYRSEELSTDGNNDDKILSCCLHYCKDNARDFMPKHRENTVTLHREVVLLTEDRNLRLKAHTRNVPVKDIISFMEWAKVR